MTKKNIMNQNEKTIQALYSRLDKTESPAELDSFILNAAHHDVAVKKHVTLVKASKKSWYVPVTSVAILIISLSVVISIALDPELIIEEVEFETSDINANMKADRNFVKKTEDLSLEKEGLKSRLMREEKNHRASRRVDEARLQLKQQLTDKQKARQKQKLQIVKKVESRSTISSMQAGDMPYAVSASVAKEKPQMATATEKDASASEWVQRLQKLYRQGQKLRFEQQLKKFRVLYPAYSLPEELAKWENPDK